MQQQFEDTLERQLQKKQHAFERSWKLSDKDGELLRAYRSAMWQLTKFSVALNGGGILAILTFVGNASKDAGPLVWPMTIFALGLMATSYAAYCHCRELVWDRTAYRNSIDEEFGYRPISEGGQKLLMQDRPESLNANVWRSRRDTFIGVSLLCFGTAGIVAILRLSH